MCIRDSLRGYQRTCSLYTTKCVTGPTRSGPPSWTALDVLPHNLQYADPDLFLETQRPIEVLIGSNNYYRFVKVNQDKRLTDSLVLLNTHFGWVPAGEIPQSKVSNLPISTFLHNKGMDSKVDPTDDIRFLWDLETLGIRTSETQSIDSQVIDFFRKTTQFENGRYVVRYPWKNFPPSLPTHYNMCFAHLRSLLQNSTQETLLECNQILRAVSYTHLTLPTIYSV